MLKDLEKLASTAIKQPVVNDETLAERELPPTLRRKIQDVVTGIVQVDAYTTAMKIPGGNIVCLPNQYFRFAAEVYEFAVELLKYLEIFDKFRDSHGELLDGDAAVIAKNLAKPGLPVSLDANDTELFARFMSKDKKEGRLSAKRPINNDGSLRTSSDCFGSVILTQINTPNASSAVLGDLIYELALRDDVYKELVDYYARKTSSNPALANSIPLPKPFVLLAGISGTGKSKFVRDQAGATEDGENFLLQPVRPDWHEPSDLLGYVSRIHKPERFVATPLLAFMAKAWRATKCDMLEDGYRIQDPSKVATHWACLDEMNLAPVEQYFADFLAIVETRSWKGNVYSCDPILDIGSLSLHEDSLAQLCRDLGFVEENEMWERFVKHGMPLPPNLVVAGTVNMDETTHGFSRKVIDRAFTLDFGEFFPNDFDAYFASSVTPLALTFPRWSRVTRNDLKEVPADSDGAKSIEFLRNVNAILEHSSFRLAYRSLNELLVAVRSFAPKNDEELAAVWDDFLMTKLLPRLEGDAEKLDLTEQDKSLLTELSEHIDSVLKPLLASRDGEPKRPDLLRKDASGQMWVPLRAPRALSRMQRRLKKHNFTSFWP